MLAANAEKPVADIDVNCHFDNHGTPCHMIRRKFDAICNIETKASPLFFPLKIKGKENQSDAPC